MLKKLFAPTDMTRGTPWKSIAMFTFPMLIGNIAQQLYSTVDSIVVGRYVGDNALAAVGSSLPILNMLLVLFIGISVGASIMVAQYFGAKNREKLSYSIGNCITATLISCVVLVLAATPFIRPVLELLNTPDTIINDCANYLTISLVGIAGMAFYNILSGIIRGMGDSFSALLYLLVATIINTVLDVWFVAGLGWGVAGVAIATVASQVFSAVLVVVHMIRSDSYLKISLKELKISKKYLSRMMMIGIPSGIQGSLFALSNVVIQSSINSFDDIVMAGNSAAGNIEGFVWIAMNSITQASITFVGQNVGAKKYDRIGKVLLNCMGVVTAVWALLAAAVFIFRYPLLTLYAGENEAVIAAGLMRMAVIVPTYFICGNMDVVCGALRSMGKSTTTMVLTLVGVCGIRILWIQTLFKLFRSPMTVYISYPVSWAIALGANLLVFVIIYRKTKRQGYISENEFQFLTRLLPSRKK